MRSALVTGGRGFVGAWLCRALLEREPFSALAADGQLRAYHHDGFWDCMDTYKDAVVLNDLWARDEAPWKLWA